MSAPLRSMADLIVPGPVWGVDPAMKGCSVCVILPPGSAECSIVWETIALPGLPPRLRKGTKAEIAARVAERRALSAPRLSSARLWMRDLFEGLRERYGAPVCVSVEQPFAAGRVIEPVQWYACGVTLEVISFVVGEGVPVRPVEPMSWKAEALGKGNGHAKKPEVMAWAREMAAYQGSREDEADATGIAACGAYRLLREREAAELAATTLHLLESEKEEAV